MAIEIDERAAEARYALGGQYGEKRMYAEAKVQYKAIIELTPHDYYTDEAKNRLRELRRY